MAADPGTWQRDWTVAPGEILLEAIEERGISQSDLARRMGRPIKTINEIVNGKAAITPETAIQLELALGISAEFWNSLEASHRVDLARARSNEELATHAPWAAAFPVIDLLKHGLIDVGPSDSSKVAALLRYFGVSSPEAWENRWRAAQVAYRSSPAFESSPHASAAWLRWGEVVAADMETAPFDARLFREILGEIREMTRRDFPLVRPRIEQLCASAGVALVLTPELSGTHLSGAARWLTANKAIIQLSLRHKTDDQFWFSFFHEARHLLTGKRIDHLDSDDENASDADEAEADRFARETLIPGKPYAEFVDAGDFSESAIRVFAKQQNVAPGIVVGRLQRDGKLDRSHLNRLKKRLLPAHA
jgi:HTH-type transcriptional regulator/antitoxin HigA